MDEDKTPLERANIFHRLMRKSLFSPKLLRQEGVDGWWYNKAHVNSTQSWTCLKRFGFWKHQINERIIIIRNTKKREKRKHPQLFHKTILWVFLPSVKKKRMIDELSPCKISAKSVQNQGHEKATSCKSWLQWLISTSTVFLGARSHLLLLWEDAEEDEQKLMTHRFFRNGRFSPLEVLVATNRATNEQEMRERLGCPNRWFA